MSRKAHRDEPFIRESRPWQKCSRFIPDFKGFLLLSNGEPQAGGWCCLTGVCFVSATVIILGCWELGGETYNAGVMLTVTRCPRSRCLMGTYKWDDTISSLQFQRLCVTVRLALSGAQDKVSEVRLI